MGNYRGTKENPFVTNEFEDTPEDETALLTIQPKHGDIWWNDHVWLSCNDSLKVHFPSHLCSFAIIDGAWNNDKVKIYYQQAGLKAPNYKDYIKSMVSRTRSICTGTILLNCNSFKSQAFKAIDELDEHIYHVQEVKWAHLHYYSVALGDYFDVPEATVTWEYEKEAILRNTSPGEWFIDPTAGKGSFLLTALKCGSNVIGIEFIPTLAACMVNNVSKITDPLERK